MFAARLPHRSRAVLLLGLSAALAVPLLGVPTVAGAEDGPAGDTVVGTLVQAWPEYLDHDEAAEHAEEGPLSWVEPEKGEAVRVATEDVDDVAAGATIEVVLGEEVADTAADEGMEPAREVLATEVLEAPPTPPRVAEALPPEWISNRVTVAMVVPAGGTQNATTLAQVVAAIDGPVADFWSRESGTGVGIGVSAQHDWPLTPYTSSCANPTTLWNEAQTKTGFVPGPGKHLLLYVPPGTPGCADGLAELKEGPSAGGRLYVAHVLTSVIAHEFGHNFGLGHSSAIQCDGTVDTGDCQVAAYGDYYDVMGASWGQVGSLNAAQLAWLGWIDPHTDQFDGYVDVDFTAAPSYRLSKYYYLQTNFRALRIEGADGAVYWLEYRTAEGPDVWLGDGRNTPGLETGVLLRRQTIPSDPTWTDDSSLLLDGSPSAPADWDADLQQALPIGVPVDVEQGGFTVTVESLAGGEAALTIEQLPAYWWPFPRDLTGDASADLIAVDRAGKLQLYPGSGTGGFLPRRTIGSGWQARDGLVMTGDWDGDGHHDLIARNPANGDLWLYEGDGAGRFASWRVIGRGWGIFNAFLSPGDWNGDGVPDLMARQRSDGALYLYPGNGSGGFGTRSRIGTGWGVMADLAATDDWDGNGVVDFVARDTAGTLYLYSGNGTGGFTGRRTIGHGWQIFTQVTGPGDWNSDGRPDLIAQAKDGALYLYRGNGSGGFLARMRIGGGWTGFRLAD